MIELDIAQLVALMGDPVGHHRPVLLADPAPAHQEGRGARSPGRRPGEKRGAARAQRGGRIALGEATATALKNGHANGETEAALEYAKRIKHEQKDFLTEQGIHAIY